MLLCTVRTCYLPLREEGGLLLCPNLHTFDIARSGYVNLLQPQDRRSKQPGDNGFAVAGRRRLHDRGVTAPLLEGIRTALGNTPFNTVLDAGCGDGFYLGNLHGDRHGVDISFRAIDAAARRYPDCHWVVANADRFIPFPDETFSLILSITGRMNPAEFRRVVMSDGLLLVAVAAPDDLIELRGKGRDRVERTVEEFQEGFSLAERRNVRTTADLDRTGVEDLLVSIYRPLYPKPVEAMRVTFSLDLLLFRPH